MRSRNRRPRILPAAGAPRSLSSSTRRLSAGTIRRNLRRFLQFRRRSSRDVKSRQLREEPCRAEDPERILEEDPRPRRREPLGLQILERAGRAQERPFRKGERKCVHGEVAPEKVGGGIPLVFPDVDLVRAKRHLEDPLRRVADRYDARAGQRRQLPRDPLGAAGRGHEIEISAASSEERVSHRSSNSPEAVLRPREGRRRRRVRASQEGAEPAPDRWIRLQREASSLPLAAGHVTLFTFEPSGAGYAVSSTLMASASRRATESPNSPPLRADPTSSKR